MSSSESESIRTSAIASAIVIVENCTDDDGVARYGDSVSEVVIASRIRARGELSGLGPVAVVRTGTREYVDAAAFISTVVVIFIRSSHDCVSRYGHDVPEVVIASRIRARGELSGLGPVFRRWR